MIANVQSWLTPALLTAGVMMLGYLLHSINAMRRELSNALLKLVRHETILQQQGFMAPHGLKNFTD